MVSRVILASAAARTCTHPEARLVNVYLYLQAYMWPLKPAYMWFLALREYMHTYLEEGLPRHVADDAARGCDHVRQRHMPRHGFDHARKDPLRDHPLLGHALRSRAREGGSGSMRFSGERVRV